MTTSADTLADFISLADRIIGSCNRIVGTTDDREWKEHHGELPWLQHELQRICGLALDHGLPTIPKNRETVGFQIEAVRLVLKELLAETCKFPEFDVVEPDRLALRLHFVGTEEKAHRELNRLRIVASERSTLKSVENEGNLEKTEGVALAKMPEPPGPAASSERSSQSDAPIATEPTSEQPSLLDDLKCGLTKDLDSSASGASEPIANDISNCEGVNNESPEITRQDVSDRLKRLHEQGVRWRSYRKMAKQIGCKSSTTVFNVVQNEPDLLAWAKPRTPTPKAQSLTPHNKRDAGWTDAVIDDAQSQELSPEDQTRIREYLERDDLTPADRALFNGLQNEQEQLKYLNDLEKLEASQAADERQKRSYTKV